MCALYQCCHDDILVDVIREIANAVNDAESKSGTLTRANSDLDLLFEIT